MNRLIVLPIWIMLQMFRPCLPKEHVWKARTPSLTQWAAHGTSATYLLSIFFWMCPFTMMFAIGTLLHG